MDTESPVSHIPGVHEIPLIIRTVDGASVRATCFAGRGARASLAVFPDMGVEASFYRGFCQSLAAEGYNALALDLRGHGGHSVRVDREWRFGYRDMLLNDWPAAVKTLRGLFPGLRVLMIGHGLGGYLSALHASLRPRDIDGLVLIGAGSAYFRARPWRQGLSELAFTQLAWSLSEIVGFFPGDAIGTGSRESAGVMRDRAYHVRTGAYFPRDMQLSERSAFDAVRMPLLGISFEDDEQCSRMASDALTASFPAASVTRWHLSPAEIGMESIGHYAWARQRDVFVRMLAEWIG
jgi:predicted alpha/beta hydrolase